MWSEQPKGRRTVGVDYTQTYHYSFFQRAAKNTEKLVFCKFSIFSHKIKRITYL